MHSFKDQKGRGWNLVINVAQARRVRNSTKVDCFRLLDDGLKGLTSLMTDPFTFVDVLYVLCQRDCQERGVSDESFGEALGGDSLEEAGRAFVDELLDFFPDQKGREALRLLVDSRRNLQEVLLAESQARLLEMDPREEARKILAQDGKPSSSNASESPASTQDPTPSASCST